MNERSGSGPRAARTPMRAMSRWERVVYMIIRAFLDLMCRVVWRMEVVGRERLPAAGPFIVAPVHRSYLDFLIVGAAIPKVMRFMAKDSIWKVAWVGRFLEHMGSFPVDREKADRTALRTVEESIAHGDPVVMFPEGRRREGPVVEDMLEGPAWVAARNRVPLVPVGLGNTDRALPMGAKFIRPVKVRVVIGEPIYPDVPATGRVPRGAVGELTAELRDAVQRNYDLSRGVSSDASGTSPGAVGGTSTGESSTGEASTGESSNGDGVPPG